MNEDVIYKYLSGDITDEEKLQVQEWLKESPQNRYYFFELKAIWNARKQIPNEERTNQLELSLRKLNDKINEREKEFDLTQKADRKRRLYLWGASVAAVALLVGSFFFTKPQPAFIEDNVIQLASFTNQSTDSVKSVVLPDGSIVWLAENATITYPESFSGESRNVILDGEAFFEVATDSVIPFIVKTDVNQIKVLGTSFSVSTHYKEEINEVILTSGAVQLQRLDGVGLVNLQPGQKALYSKESNTIEINEVDVNTLRSWKYGLITLTNASLPKILNCLQDTYKVKIEMDTAELRGKRYHFSFKRSKGVEEALDQLAFMTGVPAKVL